MCPGSPGPSSELPPCRPPAHEAPRASWARACRMRRRGSAQDKGRAVEDGWLGASRRLLLTANAPRGPQPVQCEGRAAPRMRIFLARAASGPSVQALEPPSWERARLRFCSCGLWARAPPAGHTRHACARSWPGLPGPPGRTLARLQPEDQGRLVCANSNRRQFFVLIPSLARRIGRRRSPPPIRPEAPPPPLLPPPARLFLESGHVPLCDRLESGRSSARSTRGNLRGASVCAALHFFLLQHPGADFVSSRRHSRAVA